MKVCSYVITVLILSYTQNALVDSAPEPLPRLAIVSKDDSADWDYRANMVDQVNQDVWADYALTTKPRLTIKEKENRILPLYQMLTKKKRKLPVKERDPRLAKVGHLPRGTLFSYFHGKHLEESTQLLQILLAATDFDDFMKLATQARDSMNEGLFIYALSIAVTSRDDCMGVMIPPIQEIFPDRFFSSETINLAFEEAKKHPDQDIEIESQTTGNISDPENRLEYFRKDIGINAHHWYWHVEYPTIWDEELTHKKKDRKGELFLSMHQQMCARHDSERLSNGLNRMIPLHNFEEKLEGYNPHLKTVVNGLDYASRPAGSSLMDLPSDDVEDMQIWTENILDAIDLQYVDAADGHKIALDEANGSNVLGHIIEASYSSPNRDLYGCLHNWGHTMMAKIHKPHRKLKENPGVMSETTTASRDPIFYRWHKFVDNIHQKFKATLRPYTKEQLSFEGIKVISAKVNAKQANIIHTLIKEDKLDISNGIDFGTGHKVLVKYHHLDHEPFSVIINIENNTGEVKHAHIRVFLGPKYDELGNKLTLDDQRRLMIELDKFHKKLTPGMNIINRNAYESSVTLSHSYTFEELKNGVIIQPPDAFEFCSRGWPEYLHVPKGTRNGMAYELFVMATDYSVDNPDDPIGMMTSADAVSQCSAKYQKYPDSKPMGFPFDRPIMAPNIAEFLTDSMTITDVVIQFLG